MELIYDKMIGKNMVKDRKIYGVEIQCYIGIYEFIEPVKCT